MPAKLLILGRLLSTTSAVNGLESKKYALPKPQVGCSNQPGVTIPSLSLSVVLQCELAHAGRLKIPTLTSLAIAAIKVDVMETRSMTSRLHSQDRRSTPHHWNRQDAREGGETPPLPRNCERPCHHRRRLGQWRRQEVSQGSFWLVRNPGKPLKTKRTDRLWEGG
jgi:hypothetical protein